MDRILILMSATDFSDACPALFSALDNAAAPAALSFGITLEQEPGAEGESLMASLGRVQFLCPAGDAWSAIGTLWQGEDYVLMAHPSMRFTSRWDRSLLHQLRTATHAKKPPRPRVSDRIRNLVNPEEDAQAAFSEPVRQEEAAAPQAPAHYVLTGYLPVREDPLDAICPVGADALDPMGTLTFQHGMPLRYAVHAQRTPFLHPHFAFGPAGFFRMMAEPSPQPMFLRAHLAQWALYTPVKPAIRLVWDLPVPSVSIDPEMEGMADFAAAFGIALTTGALSERIRRGLMDESPDLRLRVPLRVKWQHAWRQWQFARRQHAGKAPTPHCVTLYTADMPPETERWLLRLAEMTHLPLTAYADALLIRQVTEHLPNVRELKPRYLIDLPTGSLEEVRTLSKAHILLNARERELSPSHHVWMDADVVQYPVYSGTCLQWEKLCTDRIVLAMVGGVPDTTMFVVPDHLVMSLAREVEARCLTFIHQRGGLPTEQELWALLIREHPDWFHLQVMPVRRQLFTRLDGHT